MDARKQFTISVLFFAAIALLGLTLRAVPAFELSLNFKNFLHAHSHVAFLGWLHGAFVSFVSYIFLHDKLQTKTFKFIYWFTIINIIGMYFSFPIQGYKLFSIIFLSLFLIGTYFFLYYFFKNKEQTEKYPATYKFIKAGLWLQFLSSLSPWSLVFVLKLFGKNSHFYKYDIFYYLHFQYNGWFLFALFGLSFYLLENRGIHLNRKQVQKIYRLMLIAVFFGYFSNTLWANPGIFFNILSMIGAIAEIWALFILLQVLLRYHKFIQNIIDKFSFQIFMLVLLTLFVKAVLQFTGSVQYYADLSFQIRDFIIGYLHLVMLGIFTPFLLILAHEIGFFSLQKKSFLVFYTGFILTETLIFIRASLIWFGIQFPDELFSKILFYLTVILFSGVLLITRDVLKSQKIES